MSDLHRELEEVNRGLADEASQLIEHFSSAEGRRMLDHVWGALQPEQSTISRLRAGARAFSTLLELHPAGDGEPLTRIGIPILPGQLGYTPVTAHDAGQVLALGTLYLGLADRFDEPRIARLWDVMVGADVVDTILRHALVGKLLPMPFPRVPPDLFDRVRVFAETHCVAGVTSAAIRVTRALLAYNVTSNATGITALDPPQGCGGQTITIRGTGFGNTRPPDVQVYFPATDGRCRQADVIPPGWTDTAITVTAPPNVSVGCVGFVVDRSTGGGSLALEVSSFLGEITSCLGPLFAESVRRVWESVTTTAFAVPCPPCLPGNANRFAGGPPVIGSFLGRRSRDGVSLVGTVADLAPGDLLELSWQVTNATAVQITPVPVNGQLHELPQLAGPFATAGKQIVRWPPANAPVAYGLFSWDAAYELRATNACGTTNARMTVRMRMPRPGPPGPLDFLWGVATAGRQVEGKNTADDWHIFTTDPQILQRLNDFKNGENLKINPQAAGSALNHWAWGEFVQSVERARALGLNAYRISVEWSRIEPVPGTYDVTALGNYQMMVAAILAHGMVPVVVLNHMSLPAWVQTPPRKTNYTCFRPGADDTDPRYQASLRGWETQGTVDVFVAYVEYVVANLPNVTWWITFNEPLGTTVLTGYLASVFPPGFLGDGGKALLVVQHIIQAHARAYDAIHRINPGARVGITDQWMHCKNDQGAAETRQFVYYHQDLLINALVHGNEDRAISVDHPSNYRVLGIPESDWRPHLDFFGLQYYKSAHPRYHCGVALRSPWMGGIVDLDMSSSANHLLLNDMGWEMSPEGLYDCLMKLKQVASWHDTDLPILVAENGTAEIVDRNRSSYITAHLEQVLRAQADGAPVVGYLHWSISDNWEWIDGYRPQARFGLFSVPLPSSDPVHSITDGALALSRAVANPPLSVADAVKEYGRYQPDGSGIDHPTMSPGATWHGTLKGRSGEQPEPITLLLSSLGPGLIGMVFHVQQRRWVRLDEVLWQPATRQLHFSYRGYAIGGSPLPERIFSGVLDGDTVTGLATEPDGAALPWRVTRVAMAGMWQGSLTGNGLITLSLSCPETDWYGRVLFGSDWAALRELQVQQFGLSATLEWFSLPVSGAPSPGGGLVLSPWGAELTRLPDGLPF